jgi:hypothetical protein
MLIFFNEIQYTFREILFRILFYKCSEMLLSSTNLPVLEILVVIIFLPKVNLFGVNCILSRFISILDKLFYFYTKPQKKHNFFKVCKKIILTTTYR